MKFFKRKDDKIKKTEKKSAETIIDEMLEDNKSINTNISLNTISRRQYLITILKSMYGLKKN
jgi:hypothetical protein